MQIFLTGNPILGGIPKPGEVPCLNPENAFIENLKAVWPVKGAKCLLVASDPKNIGMTEGMAQSLAAAFKNAGLPVAFMQTLDDRNKEKTAELLWEIDLLILGGGHVPTQNAFFKEICLKEKIRNFDGIVLGISAGSMNAAKEVYAVPELPGETLDPDYVRFTEGLGLVDFMLIPHYEMIKDDLLDGKKIIEEIILPDSSGKSFYLIPDGSYFYMKDGITRLYGSGMLAKDGGLQIL